MNYLQLVGNPARRKSRKRHASGRKRRSVSAKQRRNRARFAAMARSRRKSSHPVATHSNPRRRRRFHVVSHRRRRNPSFRMPGMGNLGSTLKNGLLGASGAVVNDVAFGFAAPFLPTMFISPASATGTPNYAYTAAKIGTALVLGTALRHVPGIRSRAATMTEGAVTVTLHDLLKQMIIGFGIALPLGDGARAYPPRPVQQGLKMYPGGKLGLYPGGGGTPTASREGMLSR